MNTIYILIYNIVYNSTKPIQTRRQCILYEYIDNFKIFNKLRSLYNFFLN